MQVPRASGHGARSVGFMMNLTTLGSAPADPVLFTDRLRLAVAAYLARFTGSSRDHTESDLRCYFAWCAERGLDPLAAQRPHLELYIRWMQEIRVRRGRCHRRMPRRRCRFASPSRTRR